MSERTFDDFDAYAKHYRAIHTENIKLSGVDSLYFARMKVELLKEFEANEPIRLLDFGCGDGATEMFMLQHFSHWQIDAIDVSEQSILVAKERALSNVAFSVFDGSNTSFPDNTFDVVFIAGVLHHVNFSLHQQLLSEVFRVLKPGGRFYLFEHNPLNPVTRYLVNTCVFDKDAKLLHFGYTRKRLEKAGFEIAVKRYIIFFPRKGLFSKFIFLEKYLQWLPLGGQYFLRAVK